MPSLLRHCKFGVFLKDLTLFGSDLSRLQFLQQFKNHVQTNWHSGSALSFDFQCPLFWISSLFFHRFFVIFKIWWIVRPVMVGQLMVVYTFERSVDLNVFLLFCFHRFFWSFWIWLIVRLVMIGQYFLYEVRRFVIHLSSLCVISKQQHHHSASKE